MADIISALNRKRASLNGQKQQIRAEADRKIAEIDAEIGMEDGRGGVHREKVQTSGRNHN